MPPGHQWQRDADVSPTATLKLGKGIYIYIYIYIYKFQKEILVVTSSRGIPYGHKATYIYNQSKKINSVLTSVSATFSDQEMTRQTGSRDIHPCFSLSGSVLIPLKKNHINHQLGHIYIYIHRFKIKHATQEAHCEGLQLRIGSCPDCLGRPRNCSSPKLGVPSFGLEVVTQNN